MDGKGAVKDSFSYSLIWKAVGVRLKVIFNWEAISFILLLYLSLLGV